MPRKKPSDKEASETQAGEAIVLVGQPGDLRGEFHLQNSGDERLVFRGAQMHSLAGEGFHEAVAVARKLPSFIVRPGELRRLPLRIALAPSTAPGEYRAEIKLREQIWPVIMHVTEKVALDISPDRIVLHNDPGVVVNKRIVLSNQGNMPLTLKELAVAPLDDELLQCRLLRAVVAAVGNEEEHKFDDILTEFARQSKVMLRQSGILRVRNRTGNLTLRAGEVRPVEFEFRLPDTLDKRTRYRAVLPIYTSDLEVLIVPSFDVAP